MSHSYDKLSQLTAAANLNGTVSFVYDNLGRGTSTTDVWGQVINYTYDANDRRTKMSFGTTTKATYTYDVVNRLTKIADSSNLATSYAYDAASKLTSRTLPNNVVTTYTYDGLDRLTRLKDAKNNTVIADNNYTYNTAGAITQNIDQSGTHAYGYDAVDRLTSATYTGTPAETYTYDSVGNRTSSQRSATYSYQPVNRLTATSTASYLYDNNGNMITKSDSTGTTQFAWDFENRLTQVVTPSSGSVTYKYDALGHRIQSAPSSGASTNLTYDGNDVAQDKTSMNVITEYLNGPGIDNKIRQKTGSTLYYFAQDHLGSTTALTDSKGALVERQSYDAYGNSAGSTRTRYGLTGRERDSLTGLLYYRARFYDPQLGRFISEDPIGLAGGINSFAYVGNNPVLYRDPGGLCPQNPLPGPKPAPAPTPTPGPPDPCRDRPWATILKDWREIAGRIGWQLNAKGEPDKDIAHNTFEQIEGILAKRNFAPFPWYKPNLNFGEHGNGFHYEGELRPKEWYHVVVHASQDYPLIIPGDYRSRPAFTIEIHCERGFARPSSISHGIDFLLN